MPFGLPWGGIVLGRGSCGEVGRLWSSAAHGCPWLLLDIHSVTNYTAKNMLERDMLTRLEYQGLYHKQCAAYLAGSGASNNNNSSPVVLSRIGYQMGSLEVRRHLAPRLPNLGSCGKGLTKVVGPVGNAQWAFGAMPMGGGANVLPGGAGRQIGGNVSFAQSVAGSQPATPLDLS